MANPKKHKNGHKPHIVGFICNWDAYSGLEMAGVNKKAYPASIRLVRLNCLGRLHLGLILQAFELGAEGVMLLGCPEGQCHYESGEHPRKLLSQARKVLRLLGIDPQRLALAEIPLGDDDRFVRQVASFARRIGKTGAAAPVS